MGQVCRLAVLMLSLSSLAHEGNNGKSSDLRTFFSLNLSHTKPFKVSQVAIRYNALELAALNDEVPIVQTKKQ